MSRNSGKFAGSPLAGLKEAVAKARAKRSKASSVVSMESVALAKKNPAKIIPTSASLLPYPATVPARQERLVLTNARLKEKFVGIDNVIDTITSKITYWYLYPERSSRPLIVNLWGMTGVGKTDLVRTLKDLLGFSSMYVEITMSDRSDEDGIGYSVDSRCPRLARGESGIIVTDEFQRFRTKDSDGDPVKELAYQDLWQILSDGKIEDRISYSDIYRLMGSLRWTPDNGFVPDKDGKENPYDRHSDELVINGSGAAEIMESLLGYRLGAGADPIATGIPHDVDSLVRGGQKLKALDRYLQRCGYDSGSTVDGILRGIYQSMLQDLGADHLSSCDDYTKTIIFVIGNLDDLYNNHVAGMSSPFIPADFVREKSFGITVPSVKEALSELFFPEQVARLGNIHITYPTLGYDHYSIIAKRCMDSHVVGLKKWFPGIAIDESVLDLVLSNGIYPTQGTRPVLTTAGDVLSEIASIITSKFPEGKEGPLKVSYSKEESCFVVSQGKSTLAKHLYVGDKDRIVNAVKSAPEFLKTVTTHECGHAVALYALTGEVVDHIIVMDKHAFNLRFSENEETFGVQAALLVMYLSGYAAVRELLGSEYLTDGHTMDFREASSLIAGILRRQGMGRDLANVFGIKSIPSTIPHRTFYTTSADGNAGSKSVLLGDLTSESIFIDAIMASAHTKAAALVVKHKKTIQALSAELSRKLFMDSRDIKAVFEASKIKPGVVVKVPTVSFSEKKAK